MSLRLRPQVRQLQTLLIKPSGATCNLKCGYCFYKNKPGHHPKMSDAILERLIARALNKSSNRVSFVWQGGEPTLMGLPFFEKVVELQAKYGGGERVANGFQTNGLLINDKWASFLKKNFFLTGLSIDGPAHVHNRYRHLKTGAGSWALVCDGLKRLLDTGADVNSVSVVNDYSSKFPEETYNFLKATGITHMQFIPCVETNPANPGKAAGFSVSSKRYGDFLCRLFDCWVSDFKNGVPTCSIRNFDSVLHAYLGLEPPDCSLMESCGVYLTVESNGDVYSCDFFVEDQWRLGNLLKDDLIDLLNSKRQSRFANLKSNLPDPCKACSWLPICRGGCIKDRIRDPRDEGVNHFCDAYKRFFKHAHLSFIKLSEHIRHL